MGRKALNCVISTAGSANDYIPDVGGGRGIVRVRLAEGRGDVG